MIFCISEVEKNLPLHLHIMRSDVELCDPQLRQSLPNRPPKSRAEMNAMKRLLYLMLLSVATAAAVGCQGTGSSFSCCRMFSGWGAGYRGAPCNTCAPSPCGCPSPCGSPVYSQSMPVYGGDCGGYSPYSNFGGSPGCSSCDGGYGGMQYSPGMVIPGERMIIGGAGQIPSLPGGALSPQTVPAPQTTPIPQATPGPAGGN